MKTREIQEEALSRARDGLTESNYPAIYQGLMAKGIPQHDIQPRENVFTYGAWMALGRHVRLHEHGIKVSVFVKTEKTDPDTGEITGGSFPRSTTVFHVSQTDPNNSNGGGK